MVIVRLNNWEEFLAEIRADHPGKSIVRLTLSAQYDERRQSHLQLVAGYVNGTDIVECVHYLGLKPDQAKSDRAQEIEAFFQERKRDLEALGLLVKPGRYHAPPAN